MAMMSSCLTLLGLLLSLGLIKALAGSVVVQA
jgi:hypothetical protein